jgi:hypothetical protein
MHHINLQIVWHRGPLLDALSPPLAAGEWWSKIIFNQKITLRKVSNGFAHLQ